MDIVRDAAARLKAHSLTVTVVMSVLLFAAFYYCLDLYTVEKQFSSEKEENNYGQKIYFSLVTQATVGYGDIVPVTPIAKTAVCLQVLVTMLLAFYVGSFLFQQATRKV